MTERSRINLPPAPEINRRHTRARVFCRWPSIAVLFFAAAIVSCASPAWADDDFDKTAAKSHRHDARAFFKLKKNDRGHHLVPDIFDVDKRMDDSKKEVDLDAPLGGLPAATDTNPAQGNNNQPDNTAINPPTFQDQDFSKSSFVDLILNNRPKAGDNPLADKDDRRGDTGDDKKDALADFRKGPDDDGGKDSDRDKKKKDDHGVTFSADARRKGPAQYDEMAELFNIAPPSPSHWVPSALDPLTNAGFTIGADNGAPVPYKLNGHVDYEREQPWKDGH